MSDKPQDKPKLQIDDDWKEEARREKEQLEREAEKHAGGGPVPPANFNELVNILAMQTIAGLGGLQTPDGRAIPPNLDLAKHHIDLLDVLDQKTKGNLTPDETRLIDNVLYELRMRYVQIAGGGRAVPPHMP